MSKIGKYELVEELGRGGMGVVYKAYDSLMEREVAIKVISDVVMMYPEIKSRFYREARTAGKLSHDNITVVHDVGEDNGRPYIVMEYLPGHDLGTLLDRSESISLEQKLDYAIQICRGLSFSHSKDIIHRDIKPGNIRIVAGGKVKIMDFGIARPVSSNLTSTGAVIGTPFYMSPEQIQGHKVDKRSDIFSFGVLFYEMLTRKKPFSGEEATAVMYKIVHEEPDRIDDALIDHRNGLRDIVMKTLDKDPERRYQDLAEVADALGYVITELKSGNRKKSEELRLRIEKLLSESRGLMKGNKFKKALETVDRAARLDPASTEVARLSIEIKKAEEREARKVFIEERLQSAQKALGAKRFEKSQELIQDILKVEPENTRALKLSKEVEDAIVFSSTGDSRFAETKMIDVASPEPTTPPPITAKITSPGVLRPTSLEVIPDDGRKKLYLAGGALLLVIALFIAYRVIFHVPSAPVGYVSLNILPWGQVTKIVNDAGKEIPVGERTITPCRIVLPEGSYNITLANSSLGKTLVVTVKVKNDEVQIVKKKFSGFDYQQVLSGFQ